MSRWLYRRKVRLIAAVTAGLLSAAFVMQSRRRLVRELARPTPMTTALRARRFIPRNADITPDLVEEIQIPRAAASAGLLARVEDLKPTDGRGALRAKVAFLKGDIVNRSALFDPSKSAGLAWALKSGETAVTLRLSAEQAVGGLLSPGDYVHVISVLDGGAPGARPMSVALLRQAAVLAVNDQLVDAPGASAKDGKDVANESFLVTLSVAMSDAQRLALGAERGKIWLALASPLDERPSRPAAVSLSDLLHEP